MEIRQQFRHPFVADPAERPCMFERLRRFETRAAAWRYGDPVVSCRDIVRRREELSRLAMPADTQVPAWIDQMVALDLSSFVQTQHDAMVMWTTWQTYQAGSCWFSLSEALTTKLALTDLRGCTFADLRLPTAAFYVQIPHGVLAVQDGRTGMHDVPLLTVATGHVDTTRWVDSVKVEEGARIVVTAYGCPNARSINLMDDCSVYFNTWVPSDPAAPLEDGLRCSDTVALARMLPCRWLGQEVGFAELRLHVLRFITNLSIYLGSRHADVRHQHAAEINRVLKGRQKRQCRKTEQERVTRLEHQLDFDVGTNVTIQPELLEQAYSSAGRTGIKLQYRTLVRGHWRNQPCGQGRRDRRHVWIEPHVRGHANDTDLMTHNYMVK